MARTYMARLGQFQFSINTAAFQQLQRRSSYEWQAKKRIGRKPAQQHTGNGADEITLSGEIYPHYRGGLGQVGRMREQASRGEPLPLVYAFEQFGQYCGRWCITGIDETRTVFFDNGMPRKIEFSLSLVEYGEDAGAEAGVKSALMSGKLSDIAASKSLFPTITGNAALDQAYAKAADLAGSISPAAGKLLTNLGTQLENVHDFIGDLGDDFLTVKNAIIEGIDAVTGIKGAGQLAIRLLGTNPQAQRIINSTTALSDEVGRAVSVATRSSLAVNGVFNSIDTAAAPDALVTCLRSTSRSVGGIAKLCSDTSIAALRIRESVE